MSWVASSAAFLALGSFAELFSFSSFLVRRVGNWALIDRAIVGHGPWWNIDDLFVTPVDIKGGLRR